MKIISNGEYMPVSETGLIARQECTDFSSEWQLLGAVRFNNFGHEVERVEFSGKLLQLQWLNKNGSQRWHILDLDHGTMRVWMNPKHRIIAL
jgi:hypothetical protein